MKNLSSILNIILLIAVAILFYLHFSSPKTVEKAIVENTETPVEKIEDSLTQFINLDSNISVKPIKIAYVNNDSLTVRLNMLRDVEERIASKSKALRARIQGKQKSYERKYNQLLEDYKSAETKLMVSLPNLTDAQADEEKGKLMKRQEEIMKLEQTAQKDLAKVDEDQNRQLMQLQQDEMGAYYSKLQGFCQSFAKTLGFDYIMVYQNGGAFLYTNPDYDVSSYVIDAINKEYAQNKSLKTTTTK